MYKLPAVVAVLVSMSFGGMITIDAPGEGDLNDLQHGQAYLWRVNLGAYGIDINTIESARIEITGINNNMEPESDDVLKVRMLNLINTLAATSNEVLVFTDDQVSGDFFSTDPVWNGMKYSDGSSVVGSWSDVNGSYQLFTPYPWWPTYQMYQYVNPSENISFDIDAGILNSYSQDNNWIGFGFDPDCYFTIPMDDNCGVRLVVNTKNVPEPTLLSLLGCGLLGLLLSRRRKNNQ